MRGSARSRRRTRRDGSNRGTQRGKARLDRFAPALAGGLCAGLAGSSAEAQQGKAAGEVPVRPRRTVAIPDDRARIDGIDGGADLSNTARPELDDGCFPTDNPALERVLATTPHDIEVKNSMIGDLEIGEVWLLPPTLTLRYRFSPRGAFSLCLGADVNYTWLYGIGEKDPIQKSDIDPAFGQALQVGFDFRLGDRRYPNVDIEKIFLDAGAEIDRAIDAEVGIDPRIFGLGVGYRF